MTQFASLLHSDTWWQERRAIWHYFIEIEASWWWSRNIQILVRNANVFEEIFFAQKPFKIHHQQTPHHSDTSSFAAADRKECCAPLLMHALASFRIRKSRNQIENFFTSQILLLLLHRNWSSTPLFSRPITNSFFFKLPGAKKRELI